ncbi:unnamed protein product, partial [Staurois parvus]
MVRCPAVPPPAGGTDLLMVRCPMHSPLLEALTILVVMPHALPSAGGTDNTGSNAPCTAPAGGTDNT